VKIPIGIKKEFEPHLDPRTGYLVQRDGDMGDTIHETMCAIVWLHWAGIDEWFDGRPLKEAYREFATRLINEHGMIRRSDEPGHWTSYWWHGSGDGYYNAIIATIVMEDYVNGRNIQKGFESRGYLCTNTVLRNTYPLKEDHERAQKAGHISKYRKWDIRPQIPEPRPLFKSLFERAPWEPFTWYVAWLHDFFRLLLGMLQLLYFPTKRQEEGSVLNFRTHLEFAVRVKPTWVSKLAKRMMPDKKKLRLSNEYNVNNNNPPMDLLIDLVEGKYDAQSH